MSRVFLYARCSTEDQSTDNQVLEARQAGFAIEDHRVFAEHVSGKVAAFERPQFKAMVAKMEKGDKLVVCKLDRLGRSVVDVVNTVDTLSAAGIKVVCIQLGGVDLTSPAGKMQMQVLAAVAEFERSLVVERTQAGLARVKAEGKKKLGRKPSYSQEQAEAIEAEYAAGDTSIRQLAKKHGVSVGTIHALVQGAQQKNQQ